MATGRHLPLVALLLLGSAFAQRSDRTDFAVGETSPLDHLPPHIRQLTRFGQRADWSHDGKWILFIEKTYGDVFEVNMDDGNLRPVTTHYFHEGYTRALYLANGDILLSGARNFDAEDPEPSRRANAELWVLDKDLQTPPVPLGTLCSEGPAVSRTQMKIAWTIDHENYPDQLPEGVSQIWTADIEYNSGIPRLVHQRLVLDNRRLPFEAELETQNFRPPDENELIFSGYLFDNGEYESYCETLGIDLETGKVVNYSKSRYREEPEGIYPDGKAILTEADRHNPQGRQFIDLYKLRLDGSGEMQRLTHFNDYAGYKASNPVVSDDGRFIAFQVAHQGDPAGVGRGIFIYDIAKAPSP